MFILARHILGATPVGRSSRALAHTRPVGHPGLDRCWDTCSVTLTLVLRFGPATKPNGRLTYAGDARRTVTVAVAEMAVELAAATDVDRPATLAVAESSRTDTDIARLSAPGAANVMRLPLHVVVTRLR
jgi:hypothetical protein